MKKNDTQEHIEQLEAKIGRLEDLVHALVSGSHGPILQSNAGPGRISRNGLIRGVAVGAAGFAAAGVAGAFNATSALAFSESDATTFVAEGNMGTSGSPAGTGFQTATSSGSDSAYYKIGASLVGSQYGVLATSSTGVGVRGSSSAVDGLQGNTTANTKSGLYASDNSPGGGYGVYAFSAAGTGVFGSGAGSRSGVYGLSNGADGIQGHTKATGLSGVSGFNDSTSGSGYGVYGQGQTGVFGRSLSAGVGVLGALNHAGPPAIPANGAAVQGDGGANGYAAYFTSESTVCSYCSTADSTANRTRGR